MSPTLLEKLRAATGGDREIDDLLAAHFYPNEFRIVDGDLEINTGYEDEEGSPVWRQPDGYAEDTFPAHYTADLSAAVALVESKMPDWGWFLRRDDTDANGKRAAPVYNAALLYPHALRVTPGSAQCPTPAIALLCAFVEAIGEKT